ncbi:LamG domain-containing protein [Galbibacter orientalis]|uniref:LamG domain-containing protein n=1 Tax=Galbibacter orientalis TaxID=453852 RepID=UPI003001341C
MNAKVFFVLLIFLCSNIIIAQGYDIMEEKHSVTVEIGGKALEDVKWKENPDLITTGVFETGSLKLSPQKRGYRFSPDIFNFDDYNSNTPKIFRAYKYNLTDRLKLYLPFQKEFISTKVNNEKINQIEVTYQESGKGETAYFNGVSSYIDFGSDNTNFNELTVAVWLKPEKVSGSNSIIGKGEVFSAKIFDGNLQFTTPGIKDHISNVLYVNPNEWVHVAFVFMPNDQLFFYMNGTLIDQIKASTIANTDHSILIGSNLWGQYYKGFMKDFALWNRALSNDEVFEVYQDGVLLKTEKPKEAFLWWWLLLLIPLGGIFYFFYGYKRVLNKVYVSESSKSVEIVKDYNIRFLGGFTLIDTEGKEFTHLLSPKRRELFLLLFLYTIKNGGISSKRMGDILWPNFTYESTKNNRSTQIKELRKVFEGRLPLEINFIEKKWKLSIPESIYTDVTQLNESIPQLFSGKQIHTENKSHIQIAQIVKNGALLPQIELEWLDSFKSDYGNAILDILTPCIDKEQEEQFSKDELILICDAILEIDPLYENAVRTKYYLFTNAGKHMTAQKLIENYKRLYEAFYKESYDINSLQV